MRDRPTAVDLLQTARTTLMDQLLPALPQDLRYTAHLIAAAIAIAAREAAAGEGAGEDERAALTVLLSADESLEDLNRKFAAAIRAGRFDTDRPAPYRILADAIRAKLQENNPTYS